MKRTHYAMGLIVLAGFVAMPNRTWGQSAWPGYPNNGAISVLSNGSVGIGTTTGSSVLNVVGPGQVVNSIAIGAAGTVNYAVLGQAIGSGSIANTGFYANVIGGAENYGVRIVNPAAGTNNYAIFADATARSYFAGSVGIGTASPQYKLSVNGAIGAKEIVVTNSGWSDYVFRPGYRLRSLTDVGAYIRQHGHLPEIPSEAEVKEKGVNVGEIQAKLLAKIEELTLHMIEQETQNRELRERVMRLEARAVSDRATATKPQK